MSEPANGFEFLEELEKRGGKRGFFRYTRFLQNRAREKGIPIHGQFELTPLCNFNCGMCYVHLEPGMMNGRAVIPPEQWKKWMKQAWDAGMLHATLTGGECLAYPGFEELFLFLQELGCRVNVLTNGSLLNDERIRFFTEHMPDQIQVTLYGWNDDVYERVTGRRAFSAVTENVRRAIAAGLRVCLCVTPTVILGEDVFQTIRVGRSITRKFTVNSAVFPPREETGRAGRRDDPETEMYIRIYRLLDELDGREAREISPELLPPPCGPYSECTETGLDCGGGRSSFVIKWDGTMAACNRMDMICADMMRDGFSAAWAEVNRQANAWPRVPECRGCPYARVCSSCAADTLRWAEPGKRPAKLCERTKCLVSHGVRHLPDEDC